MTLFGQLCVALRNRLGRTIGDINRVVVVGQRPKEGYPNLVGDRDLLFRIRGFGVDQGSVAGGGEKNTLMKRLIDLNLRSRRRTDQVNADLNWFLANDGQLAYESQIIKAVQMFFGSPADEPDGVPTGLIGQGEPLRIVNGGDATKDLYETDGAWGSSVITIECVFREPITPTGEVAT